MHSKMYSHEIETDEQLCQFLDQLDVFDYDWKYDEFENPIVPMLRPHNKSVSLPQEEETIAF